MAHLSQKVFASKLSIPFASPGRIDDPHFIGRNVVSVKSWMLWYQVSKNLRWHTRWYSVLCIRHWSSQEYCYWWLYFGPWCSRPVIFSWPHSSDDGNWRETQVGLELYQYQSGLWHDLSSRFWGVHPDSGCRNPTEFSVYSVFHTPYH